jgi:hypothetical protein
MRTIITALALVLGASVANAAPIHLSCKGTWELHGIGDEVKREPETLAITMDIANNTVKMSFSEQVYKIDHLSDDDVRVDFVSVGLRTVVTLNRITGVLNYSSRLDKTYPDYANIFEGTCKPAQKLF